MRHAKLSAGVGRNPPNPLLVGDWQDSSLAFFLCTSGVHALLTQNTFHVVIIHKKKVLFYCLARHCQLTGFSQHQEVTLCDSLFILRWFYDSLIPQAWQIDEAYKYISRSVAQGYASWLLIFQYLPLIKYMFRNFLP